jgi:hypothetical protein
VELMQGPSVERVADILLAQLNREDAGNQAPTAATNGTAVAVEVNGQAAEPHAHGSNGNGKSNGHAAAAKPGDGVLDSEGARHLLGKLEEMSDTEMDSLLNSMLAEKETAK